MGILYMPLDFFAFNFIPIDDYTYGSIYLFSMAERMLSPISIKGVSMFTPLSAEV